jgi:hypothetical protein
MVRTAPHYKEQSNQAGFHPLIAEELFGILSEMGTCEAPKSKTTRIPNCLEASLRHPQATACRPESTNPYFTSSRQFLG